MKQVIFKECERLKVTTEQNYNAFVRDSRKVQDCGSFDSPAEIIEYYCKWFGSQETDFIVEV